jgi:hypothetical protein
LCGVPGGPEGPLRFAALESRPGGRGWYERPESFAGNPKVPVDISKRANRPCASLRATGRTPSRRLRRASRTMLHRRASRPDVPAPRTMPATPPTRMADVSPSRLVVPPNDVVDAGDVPSSRVDEDRRVSVTGYAATLQPGQPTPRLYASPPPPAQDRRPNGRLAALRISPPDSRDGPAAHCRPATEPGDEADSPSGD